MVPATWATLHGEAAILFARSRQHQLTLIQIPAEQASSLTVPKVL
jgi:hypothetical protein